MDDRRQNPHDCVMGAACHIGNLNAHRRWPAVCTAAMAAYAREGEVIDVVPGAVPVGAGLAVAGDSTVDKIRPDRLQSLVPNAEAVHHAGAELLDDDVIAFYQLEDFFGTPLFFQVEPDGHLAPVQKTVGRTYTRIVRRHNPGQIDPIRRLHPQHLRPHIRQQHGGVGPGQ